VKCCLGSIAEFAPNADSLLVNVCGRLIMLHPQQAATDRKPSVGSSGNNQLQPPLLIASAVEQVWCQPEISSAKPHLAQAMWLHCGAQGMKVIHLCIFLFVVKF
jgi:hypothetical protein